MTPRRPVLAIVAGCALSVLLTGRDLNAQPVDAPSHTQLGGSAGVVFFLPTFGLVPPAAGVRVRARLRHDRSRPPQAVQTEDVHLYFEVIDPVVPTTQSSMRVSVPPGEEWLDLELTPALYCCLQPLTVRYAYVPFRSTSPATMEIDRIELTK
jgi:hypothetical protein